MGDISCFDLWDPKDTLCYGFTKAVPHSQSAFDGYQVFFFPHNSAEQHISGLRSIWRSSQFFLYHDALFPGSQVTMYPGRQRPLVILCDHFNWAMVWWVSLSPPLVSPVHSPSLSSYWEEDALLALLSVQAVFHTVQLMQHLNAEEAPLPKQQAQHNFCESIIKFNLDLGNSNLTKQSQLKVNWLAFSSASTFSHGPHQWMEFAWLSWGWICCHQTSVVMMPSIALLRILGIR